MGYEPRGNGGWSYDGLPIQADVETHQYSVSLARRTFPAGARVIDIGAGSGALAKQLIDAGFDVACTSWDGRVAVPAVTYRLDLDTSFSLADVGGAPYDLVCCLEVIEHVENPSALLRSLRGIVRPGGRVLLSTPNVESAQSRLQWLLRGTPLIFQDNEVRRNRHISMMWREGLEFLIGAAGFDIVQKELLGPPRLRSRLQRAIKGPLYRLMGGLLRGDLSGETRMYVLAVADRDPKRLGPRDVY